jgi:hypothetical protein
MILSMKQLCLVGEQRFETTDRTASTTHPTASQACEVPSARFLVDYANKKKSPEFLDLLRLGSQPTKYIVGQPVNVTY